MVLHVHLAQQLMKNAKFDEKSHAHGDATQRMRKKQTNTKCNTKKQRNMFQKQRKQT